MQLHHWTWYEVVCAWLDDQPDEPMTELRFDETLVIACIIGE
jgi:hypothetical protein